MVLSRESFRNVGGFSGDYAIGDYEDSDLCLKLRARGGICHYAPHTELYHFERQSISQAPDARGAGATAYNRHLHHAIWSADIETLMSRPEFKAGTHAE
jgi:GT2 family glycosyltransferase